VYESFTQLSLIVLSFDHSKLQRQDRRGAFYDLNMSGLVPLIVKFSVFAQIRCAASRHSTVSAPIFATKSN